MFVTSSSPKEHAKNILYLKGFVVSGILSCLISRPIASESEFRLVQALCSAFALCQQGESAFACKTGLLWPSRTVCQ